jgi:hypothetical protein
MAPSLIMLESTLAQLSMPPVVALLVWRWACAAKCAVHCTTNRRPSNTAY